jgi:alpha-tubulin suppressor-like RCC1 family protein
MKKLLLMIILLFATNAFSQCTFTQTFVADDCDFGSALISISGATLPIETSSDGINYYPSLPWIYSAPSSSAGVYDFYVTNTNTGGAGAPIPSGVSFWFKDANGCVVNGIMPYVGYANGTGMWSVSGIINNSAFGGNNGGITNVFFSGISSLIYGDFKVKNLTTNVTTSLSPTSIGGSNMYSFTVNNLPAGNYQLEAWQASGAIPGGYGCPNIYPFIITEPAFSVSTSLSNGNSSICTTPTSGTGPYSYSLNGASSQPNNCFNGLIPGTYTITITDALGGTASTVVSNFVIQGQANCWKAVACGGHHTIAVKSDGSLWAWGWNNYGQLGNNTVTTTSNLPIQVGTDNNWASVAVGQDHSLALKTDGTLWAWGKNVSGQVGDGTIINKNIPTQIGTDNDWRFIASSGSVMTDHSIAIKTNNSMWGWGANGEGQLGIGSIINANTPTQVGTSMNWNFAAIGGAHSVATKIGGQLFAAGSNNFNTLGIGTTSLINSNVFVACSTGANTTKVTATQVSSHAIAFTSEVLGWGESYNNEFGNGTLIGSNVPIISAGALNNWNEIRGGTGHVLGIQNTTPLSAGSSGTQGTLWAWGFNADGQTGAGVTIDLPFPTQIGTESNWKIISAGAQHSAAINTLGELYVSGWNITGQLGIGSFSSVDTFTKVDCFESQVVPCNIDASVTINDSTNCQGDSVHINTTVNGTLNPTIGYTYNWFNTTSGFWMPTGFSTPDLHTIALSSFASLFAIEVVNSFNCKDTVYFSLTNYAKNKDTLKVIQCGDYTWTNGTTYGTTGFYNQNFLNAAGCDSNKVLDLTILDSISCIPPCINNFVQSLAGLADTTNNGFTTQSLSNIFKHPDGVHFYVTGLKNDSTTISYFDAGGTHIWTDKFKYDLNYAHQVRDMYVDQLSGDLMGVGVASNQGSAFRYNTTTHSIVWANTYDRTSWNNYLNIHSLDATNAIITSSKTGNIHSFVIDKATGTITPGASGGYQLSGDGGEYYSVLDNNILYGSCRRYYNSAGDFRAGIFAQNAITGAFLWGNAIISVGNTSGPNQTRMYPNAPIKDGDSLLIIASGNLIGFGSFLTGPQDLVLAKTNNVGIETWTKQYTVTSLPADYDRPVSASIKNTSDGYYLVGNYYAGSLNFKHKGFVIKTDKQGNVLWSKQLGIGATRNEINNVAEIGGSLFVTMSSNSYSVSNDLLVIKLDALGYGDTTCELINYLPITVNDLAPVNNAFTYNPTNNNNVLIPQFATPQSLTINPITVCATCCPLNAEIIHNDTTQKYCTGDAIEINTVINGVVNPTGSFGYAWYNTTPSWIGIGTTTPNVNAIASGANNYTLAVVIESLNGICKDTFYTSIAIGEPSLTDTITASGCQSFYWPLNGATYIGSGYFPSNYINISGCDSNKILNLTIYQFESDTINITQCNPYTWTNGTTYGTTGIYNQSFNNINGCDSIKVLNLTISTSGITNCQNVDSINISTGISTVGTSISAGTADDFWIDSATGTLLIEPYNPVWQPTPIAATNAGWINHTGFYDNNWANLGARTFERDFSISSLGQIVPNFSIAVDDSITDIQLIDPIGNIYPLSITPFPVSVYSFTTVTTSPIPAMIGTWKIKAHIFFVDGFNGFLLSGNILRQECDTICCPINIVLTQTNVSTNYCLGKDTLIKTNATINGLLNPPGYTYQWYYYFAGSWSAFGPALGGTSSELTIPLSAGGGAIVEPIALVTTQPNGFCKDTAYTIFNIVKPSRDTLTIYSCIPYGWTNGQTYINEGYYNQNFTNSMGCDSIKVLHFIVGQIVCDSTSINISTGVNNLGLSLAVGALDPNWIDSANGAQYANNGLGSTWQPAPIAGTNARWMSHSGSPNNPLFNQLQTGETHFTFVRNFNITSLSGHLIPSIKVAADDSIINIEIVSPSNIIYSLGNPAPSYYLGPTLSSAVPILPEIGVWTLKVRAWLFDATNSILVSGFVNQYGDCDTICCKTCGVASLNLSTGVNNDGSLIAFGANDPHWMITAYTGVPITSVIPISIVPVISWFNSTPSLAKYISSSTFVTNYTFERKFDVCKSGDFIINLTSQADNSDSIFVDGIYLANTTAGTAGIIYGFLAPNKAIASSVVVNLSAGSHSIISKVENENGTSVGYLLNGMIQPASNNPGELFDDSCIAIALAPFAVGDVLLSGKNMGKINTLSWKTNNKVNTKNYELQSSNDGVVFQTIRFIAANEIANNEQWNILEDEMALNNYRFYQVVQNLNDGRVNKSNIVLLQNNKEENAIIAYPNPTSGITNVEISSTKTTSTVLYLYNAQGAIVQRIVTNLNKGSNSITLDLTELPSGIYALKTNVGNDLLVTIISKQ